MESKQRKNKKDRLTETSFGRIYTMLLREPLNPLMHTIMSDLKLFSLFQRSFKLFYREYEDVDRGEGNKNRFIYVGEGESLNYLEELYFTGLRKRASAKLSLLGLRGELGHLVARDCFIFVEVNRLLNFIIPRGFFLTFPWIKQKVHLHGAEYLRRKQKISSNFGRKVRKYGYHSRVTRDPGTVVRFYNEFYVPYIKDRFHELSSLRSLGEFQGAVGSGFLLQVFDKEEWVSGAIFQVRGKCITVLAFGVHRNHFHLLRHGVLSSVYYFIFLWAEKTSMETVDLLRSKANSRDGVYEHKRRWGALPEKDPWLHTAIWIYTPDPLRIPFLMGKQLIWCRDRFIELKSIHA